MARDNRTSGNARYVQMPKKVRDVRVVTATVGVPRGWLALSGFPTKPPVQLTGSLNFAKTALV
jgi:hypothetical protein